MTESKPARRAYNSTVRKKQAARTRERIVTAAADLLHGFPGGTIGAPTSFLLRR